MHGYLTFSSPMYLIHGRFNRAQQDGGAERRLQDNTGSLDLLPTGPNPPLRIIVFRDTLPDNHARPRFTYRMVVIRALDHTLLS